MHLQLRPTAVVVSTFLLALTGSCQRPLHPPPPKLPPIYEPPVSVSCRYNSKIPAGSIIPMSVTTNAETGESYSLPDLVRILTTNICYSGALPEDMEDPDAFMTETGICKAITVPSTLKQRVVESVIGSGDWAIQGCVYGFQLDDNWELVISRQKGGNGSSAIFAYYMCNKALQRMEKCLVDSEWRASALVLDSEFLNSNVDVLCANWRPQVISHPGTVVYRLEIRPVGSDLRSRTPWMDEGVLGL